MTMYFNRGELFDKVKSRVVSISPEQIRDGIISGAQKVWRGISLNRVSVGRAEPEGDKSKFLLSHAGWDFGKIIRFYDGDDGRNINITSGEPLVDMRENPLHTIVTCRHFADDRAGEAIANPQMECALMILGDTTDNDAGIPDIIYRQFRDLFLAAAMVHLVEFLDRNNTTQVNWMEKYRKEFDSAREKFSPSTYEIGGGNSPVRPYGGGVWEGDGVFGGRYGIF